MVELHHHFSIRLHGAIIKHRVDFNFCLTKICSVMLIFRVSWSIYILYLGCCLHSVIVDIGVRSSVVVKALCYKSKGRGFDTR
jgi:hypothetical protein